MPIWESNTERSLQVGWFKDTEGPGTATYIAWGGCWTVILNVTPEQGIPIIVYKIGSDQPVTLKNQSSIRNKIKQNTHPAPSAFKML